MADMNTQTATADTQNQASTKLYRDAETATQNRDNALGTANPVKGTVLDLKALMQTARDALEKSWVVSPEVAMDFTQPCRRLSETQ